MKANRNYHNKILGIGVGGIGCPCCTDYSYKNGSLKKRYSRKRRRLMKQELYTIIKDENL